MRCLFAAVVLVVGCGDNIPWIALDMREQAETEAECAYLIHCGLLADTERCLAYFRHVSDPSLGAAVAAGKIRYDGTSAHECYLARRERSCDSTDEGNRHDIPACDVIFVGVVKAGAACAFDTECGSSHCDAPSCPEGSCCEGVCSAPREPVLGDSCSSTSTCSDHSFCSADRICSALGVLESECSSDAECTSGLGCVGGRPGRCRPLPRLDESCPFLRCAEVGARCASGDCVPTGLPGDPCTTNDDCSIYTECDTVRGLCIETPALDEPCSRGCAGSSWCRFNLGETSGVCVQPLPDGAMCSAGNQCASFSCPDALATCAARVICI